MLDILEHGWGLLAKDFIVGLPRTKHGFDAFKTWDDRLSRRGISLKVRSQTQ